MCVLSDAWVDAWPELFARFQSRQGRQFFFEQSNMATHIVHECKIVLLSAVRDTVDVAKWLDEQLTEIPGYDPPPPPPPPPTPVLRLRDELSVVDRGPAYQWSTFVFEMYSDGRIVATRPANAWNASWSKDKMVAPYNVYAGDHLSMNLSDDLHSDWEAAAPLALVVIKPQQHPLQGLILHFARPAVRDKWLALLTQFKPTPNPWGVGSALALQRVLHNGGSSWHGDEWTCYPGVLCDTSTVNFL